MQITINTDTDDLPAAIRMLQAYGGHQATTALVADVKELSQKVESAARSMGIPGAPADQVYTGAALQAIDPKVENLGTTPGPDHTECDDRGCPVHYADPTPEQVFAAPKSLFDSYVPGDNITVREAREARSDVTVDAAGLPWDARIHSGAKSKLANGNWKLLRGVDPALVASVEAELRGDPKSAPSAAEPVPAPAPPVSTAALAASAPVPPPPPAAPPAPKPITNAAELVAAVMDKRFTTDQVNAACQAVGIENVASLLAKQDKLPEVLKELGV